jgi:type II secretory ATPase GspE/PulE/Tfp pilus assembly ATPase PilB-like protein/FixJ family two-component response regulator/RNA polymerase subunit RPABC4/transcription elongation factor Spt4
VSKLAGLFKSHTNEEVSGAAQAEDQASGVPETAFALLFVDDEYGVLQALRRIFLDENYQIFTATNGEEALEIMKKETVHLVISDHRMPGMTGAQLLRKIKEEWPQTIRIMLTGYADVQSVMGAVNEGAVYKFITKPWNDEDLRLTVSLALQQYVLIQENRKLKELTQKQRVKISKYAADIDQNKGVLATYLVRAGVAKQEDIDRAHKKRGEGELLGETLVKLGITSEGKIAKVLNKQLGYELIDLREVEVAPAVARFLPRDLCERNRILPIKLSNKELTLAMADPSDMYKIDNISMMTSLKVVPVISRSSDILAKLQAIYGEGPVSEDLTTDFEVMTDLEPLDEIDIIIDEDEEHVNLEELLGSTKVPPIIRIVNAIISEAIRYKASDIHIEPKTKYSLIRYRIDGMLHDKIKIPLDLHPATISRIKILGKLDIAERRVPQDGRITVKSGTRIVDIRLSTMPTINGEKVVMRILDKAASIKALEDLGVLPRDFAKITTLIKKPQGIIISTGPTGSGKTTTLYSILNSMLLRSKSFQTVEDPVEYFLEDANQIYVKEKVGLSFASVLRATLRQDPDVLLVGEIRDFETADVAFKCALTGHMVLTSLHTNSAVGSITRLMDMGVKPYMIAAAIEGILAQRLVRRVCKHCKQEEKPDYELLELLKVPVEEVGDTVCKGKGCSRCNETGYLGRTGLFEFFVMNDDFRHMISTDYKEAELVKMARFGGMTTLIEDGMEKVALGETTLDEIVRVVGAQTKYERRCEKCQKMIEVNFLFCPHCGVFKENICANCRLPLEEEWQVCPACGRKKGVQL